MTGHVKETDTREIPIANIYHLLCYAWDFFQTDGIRQAVERDDHKGYAELLVKVLTAGCVHLLKQGLHRDYAAITEAMPAIRGKLELSATLATGKLLQGQTVCTHDEFTADIPANQILKSVLLRCAGLPGMDVNLATAARQTALRMTGVARIEPDVGMLGRVRIHRNNRFCGFLLSICGLLLEAMSVREPSGSEVQSGEPSLSGVEQQFYQVLQDRLPSLFEAFVRNFYRKQLAGEGWSRFQPQHIDWSWTPLSLDSSGFLPKMITDVTLEHPDRKIILDSKFYSSGGLNDRDKFESANLYQIHAYVTQLARQAANGKATHPHDSHAEGILLYATVGGKDFLRRFMMPPHRMSVATVNLALPWRAIEARLLEVIAG